MPEAEDHEWRQRARAVSALQASHPAYEISTYSRHRSGQVRYVAQRRPGYECQPFAVISTDPAELHAALP